MLSWTRHASRARACLAYRATLVYETCHGWAWRNRSAHAAREIITGTRDLKVRRLDDRRLISPDIHGCRWQTLGPAGLHSLAELDGLADKPSRTMARGNPARHGKHPLAPPKSPSSHPVGRVLDPPVAHQHAAPAPRFVAYGDALAPRAAVSPGAVGRTLGRAARRQLDPSSFPDWVEGATDTTAIRHHQDPPPGSTHRKGSGLLSSTNKDSSHSINKDGSHSIDKDSSQSSASLDMDPRSCLIDTTPVTANRDPPGVAASGTTSRWELLLLPGGKSARTSAGDASKRAQHAGAQVLEVSPSATLQAHTRRVRCLLYLPATDTLVSGGGDRTIKLWKRTPEGRTPSNGASSGGAAGHPGPPGTWACVDTLLGHNSAVTLLAANGPAAILSGSDDGTVRSWALADDGSGWECLSRVKAGRTKIVGILPEGPARFFCATADAMVEEWRFVPEAFLGSDHEATPGSLPDPAAGGTPVHGESYLGRYRGGAAVGPWRRENEEDEAPGMKYGGNEEEDMREEGEGEDAEEGEEAKESGAWEGSEGGGWSRIAAVAADGSRLQGPPAAPVSPAAQDGTWILASAFQACGRFSEKRLAMVYDGEHVLAAGADKCVKSWARMGPSQAWRPIQHLARVTGESTHKASVARIMLLDAVTLLTISADKCLQVWRRPRTEPRDGDDIVPRWVCVGGPHTLHLSPVTDAVMHPGGRVLFTCSMKPESVIKVWVRAPNPRPSSVARSPGHWMLVARLNGHIDGVNTLALDGDALFSGGNDGTIKVWHPPEIQA
eukprot:jgi/Mesvir1/24217/Mv10928-RA.1